MSKEKGRGTPFSCGAEIFLRGAEIFSWEAEIFSKTAEIFSWEAEIFLYGAEIFRRQGSFSAKKSKTCTNYKTFGYLCSPIRNRK